jgi:hypothetical protein
MQGHALSPKKWQGGDLSGSPSTLTVVYKMRQCGVRFYEEIVIERSVIRGQNGPYLRDRRLVLYNFHGGVIFLCNSMNPRAIYRKSVSG